MKHTRNPLQMPDMSKIDLSTVFEAPPTADEMKTYAESPHPCPSCGDLIMVNMIKRDRKGNGYCPSCGELIDAS